MTFEKIDRDTWVRKEYFEHYFSNIPCTYSMTVRLDITQIVKQQVKLYPAMLYYLTTVVNRHSEFRTAFNENNELGIYSEMIPCYTVFHKDTEAFSNIWTNYTPNFEEFCNAYENDILQYVNEKGMTAKPNVPSNYFNVSMIPWATFEGFNLNLQKGYDYLKPIFTIGKYYQETGRTLIPLATQVHHAVCDGFHVCRLIDELQELINN
ncbi:type A chloramphenicol O-acetyltransferase [Cloacibacillus porcorum]|uniref:Chloramphenicol acetyltransferase n=1 Tax=Cloacibacillus porcorum TaxID=1197717 RepID=A0A1B2I169_9BACT|nr:type A chloramphenicol O-acetyltransferase [Cloacibacillus porcorum]ANZ43710.1 type A chloramphenicol O-acetyltransferase [Cloacibacillus porcorum]MCI5863863.1 type A chloramphenicol O-acetyltransferase [Cloacibacillus porcorum]